MKDFAKNFGLLILALGLAPILIPIGIVTTVIKAIQQRSFRKIIGYLSNSALSVATGIDIVLCTICRDFLNGVMKKPGGYEFGKQGETASRGLGKNKQLNNESDLGRATSNLLNRIDKNHVENAAKPINLP